MRTSMNVAATLLFLASNAFAQSATFDGKWGGRMLASAGDEVRIDLLITKSGGKLRLLPGGGLLFSLDTQDPCHYREIPVDVETRSEKELSFVVRGDSVLRGCFKGAGTVNLVDDKTLEGTMKDGRNFKLSRKS